MSTFQIVVSALFLSTVLGYHASWGVREWQHWRPASRHPPPGPHYHRRHFTYPNHYHGPYWFRVDPFHGNPEFIGEVPGAKPQRPHPLPGQNNNHNDNNNNNGIADNNDNNNNNKPNTQVTDTDNPNVSKEETIIPEVNVLKPTKPIKPTPIPTEKHAGRPGHTHRNNYNVRHAGGFDHTHVRNSQLPLQTDFPGCHKLDDTVRSMLESNCLLEASLTADKKRCFVVSCLNSCEAKDGSRHQANTTWFEHNGRAECGCRPFANMFYFPIPALAKFAPHPLHKHCDWNGCVSKTGHFHKEGEIYNVGTSRCQCVRKPDPFLADATSTHSYVCDDDTYQPSIQFSDSFHFKKV